MTCLIEFLMDDYQEKLRLLAQGRNERHEDAIEHYKKLFVAHLDSSKEECTQTTCPYWVACSRVRQCIENISEEEINALFDALRDIYIQWIDANPQKALKQLEEVADKYRLMEFETQIKGSDIYFKGRSSENVLTRWDMFHIPFNKRYLISNQRYSLTGQPIVYAGRSVIDIIEELGTTDIEKLKISTLQPPEDMKVYDLRNDIAREVSDLATHIALGFGATEYEAKSFYKIILASVCSFRKKQEQQNPSFCEEYVIPQLIAQCIKSHGFKGIIYYSTKKFKDVLVKEGPGIAKFACDNTYKENLAIFTRYNKRHVYDRKLFNELKISVPISLSRIEKMDMTDLKSVKDEIIKKRKQETITNAETIVSSFERVYNKISINGEKYVNTEPGQLHLYHLYEVLNQILVS